MEDLSATRRISSSDDLEISTYLEIAKGQEGQQASVETSSSKHRGIIVVDFGSQYSHLIARRIRELNVYCEIFSVTSKWEEAKQIAPSGVILSGGPASVYEDGSPLAPSWVYDCGLPVLGICYGMQVMAHQLGGEVSPSVKHEYGHAVLHQNVSDSPLFTRLEESLPVWMSHGDQIKKLPAGFESLAYTENSPTAVMGNEQNMFGIQFHPEVAHTPGGREILRNFVFNICVCSNTWTPSNFVSSTIASIKHQVGKGKVICALSGGIDSAVTATLIHEAVGDQLTCIFVNNGLLRKEEADRVRHTFQNKVKMDLLYSDSSERFLTSLKGIVDPEEKRKVIGREFIAVFEDVASTLGHTDFLAQGTLYPDVIESKPPGSTTAAMIKTHHNVGGLPDNMKLELVEPLRYLFKDEIRGVGEVLGLPPEIINRQPFPGPGLAIRILGEVTEKKLRILRDCDWIVIDEIKAINQYDQLWQTFAVLTNSLSVGVVGDKRTYGYVVAIRGVSSDDAMTADWARLPYDVLSKISSRIVNEVPEVSRVVYDITSKPPGTIEWE